MSDMSQDQRSGWNRTLLTSAIGLVALAGSTYTVISKITNFESKQDRNSEIILTLDQRLQNLENARLPDGLKMGQLTETLKSLEKLMIRIETRMDVVEKNTRLK